MRSEGEIAVYLDRAPTDPLFLLPPTYFLTVTEISGDTCRVIYCHEDYDYARAVYGYASLEGAVFTDLAPTGRSFPNVFLKFEGNGTFYKNNRLDSFYSSLDWTTTQPFFYGYLERDGKRFCYVFADGKLGYFSVEVFEAFTIPRHADPVPVLRAPTSDSFSEQSASSGFFQSDTNKVIFITVACIIAVCAVYLIFLPKKASAEPDTDFDSDE
jgi:hypothetical protein